MSSADSRVCLITGAAGGIGLAIAQRFAGAGEHVVIGDVDTGRGRSAARATGATFVALDVSDEAAWEKAIRATLDRFGRLDVLVNNAGIDLPNVSQNPADVALADWRRIMAVNVDGVMLGCRQALRVMQRGGAIVNVSSIAALVGTPQFAAYGASKAAVMQLTKSIAAFSAAGGLGIRCNSLHPGIVETDLVRGFWRKLEADSVMSYDEARATFLAKIPVGEFATAEDIAHSAEFLASPGARHVTGAHLVVDGGITLNTA